MRYQLLICIDEAIYATQTPDEASASMARYAAFQDEMGRRGVLLGGDRLHPATDATTVRVRNGEVLTSDGPFAETKEQIGGYYLVECEDLDEAIEVAGEDPGRGHRHDRDAADLGHVTADVEAAVARAFRDEWGRVVATLIRVTGDWDLAEECAQDAFARALERWPRDGVPAQPGGLADHDRPQPRHRPAAAGDGRAAKLRGGGRGDRAHRAPATAPTTGARRERDRRRPAAADLHLLPPGAGARGAGGADAAHPGRADDRRDRPGLPGARADDGPAAGAGQATRSATPASPTGCRRPTCCPSAPAPCWPCSTCCSTRGTRPPPAPTCSASSCAPRRIRLARRAGAGSCPTSPRPWACWP